MSELHILELPTNDVAERWLTDRAVADLDRARALVAELKAANGADATELLTRWDEVERTLGNLASVASTFSELHTEAAVREAGDQVVQDVDKLSTEFSQDTELFALFDGASADGLDALAARLYGKVLRDFRRSGVDRDQEVRDRLRDISERLVVLGQDFSKNIRDDVRSIQVPPSSLDGMPQDWIEEHPAGDDGLVRITTDYPDLIPFSTFAHDGAARRELRVQFLNQAWPANDAVLKEIFALRAEYAQLLGYANWAAYDAEVKMIGTDTAIAEFIDSISEAAAESAVADREVILDRLREDRPAAVSIDAADLTYYNELVSKERFGVDSQKVRTYFDFARVRQGLLEVTGRLFGLEYREVDAVVWHEDVATYDVFETETERHVGRILLDLHPRDGKFKHAAQFDLIPGVAGVALPQGVLACNFSRGLMEHDDVVTLFHEFGHLLHHILAGHGKWVRFSGVATEWDFVEAPSQMLEEWAWDADVLASFALNADGEPIPADLVAQMREADNFGKGLLARTQMFYAAMSYYFHTEDVEDLTQRTKELQAKYSLLDYIPDTHMSASFGHLDGYSSGYYTYMWSLVIAKDMFSAFDSGDMFNPEVAALYRDRVLVPGGNKDAADLVADFLGRPYSFDAFAQWLAK